MQNKTLLKTLCHGAKWTLLVPVFLLPGCSGQNSSDGVKNEAASAAAPQAKPPVNFAAKPAPSLTDVGEIKSQRLGHRITASAPVAFRIDRTVGRKVVSETLLTREDASGTPFKLRSRLESELVSSQNERTKWKSIRNENIEEMGDHHFATGEGLAKNRITFETYNRFGNLLESEGETPDTPLVYGVLPQRPVRPGDVWKGYVMYRGQKSDTTGKLEYLESIGGRIYAVIRSKMHHDGRHEALNWVDVKTGDSVRSDWVGIVSDTSGSPFKYTARLQVLKADGNPVLASGAGS